MNTRLIHKDISLSIISNIKNCKKSIKIAVAWFTNPEIYDAIADLISNDISIEIILCDDKINFTNPKLNIQKLIDLEVVVRVSKNPYLMHNKFCIIDNRILITGSYNWTLRAEQYNYENIILSTEKDLINQFDEYFTLLKEKTNRILSIPKSTFENYYSKKEIDFELNLEIHKNESIKKPENTNIKIYSDVINEAIEKANLLYLNADHEQCIDFCNNMIIKHPQIPEFYYIIASSYWRTNNIDKQIESAQKAIAIDNEMYDAYNLLGIAYSRLPGKEQLSIKNYSICLNEFPNEHVFLRNRADSYMYLETDPNIPLKIREGFRKKADQDLNRIIEIVSKKSIDTMNYSELFSRASSYLYLDKRLLAKKDITIAIDKYKAIKDRSIKDENEYREMKSLLTSLRK